MKKGFWIYIGGLASGLVLAAFMVIGASIMGAISFNPLSASPAMATTVPVPTEEALPPTHAPTRTSTAIPTRTPTPPTETGTPTISLRTCGYTNGVYVLITVEDGKAVYYSNNECFEVSINGQGQSVKGEKTNKEIKVLGRSFATSYRFSCDFKTTRESACGLHLDELVFYQFDPDLKDVSIGPAQENYGLGDYMIFMQFATQTPTP